MRVLKLACLLLVMTLPLTGCEGDEGPKPQNLLLIGVDTVRFDAFFLPERAGFNDSLSDDLEHAVVFTKAQAASSWTLPSVASALTGLYPAQHGAGRFAEPVANLDEMVPSRLDPAVLTLTERLQAQGFATLLINSNPWLKAPHGLEQGFEMAHARKGDPKLAQLAIRWLKAYRSEPFFLYLHLMGAHERHTHWQHYDKYLDAAEPALLKAAVEYAPGPICNEPEQQNCRRWKVYLTAVMQQRKLVAKVLDTLHSQGLMGSTLVVLYADHGEEFYEHKRVEGHWQADPRGFYGVGHGQTLFQELLHVPLVVWQPGLPGQAAQQVVSLVDLTPSILNWLGLDKNNGEFSGHTITGLNRSRASPFAWSDYSAAHWPDMERKLFASGIAYGPEQIAVLSDGWKYIWHEATGESFLYNLHQDPAESNPVAHAEVISRLEPALDRYFTWLSTKPSRSATLTEQQIKELKGMGYLQGVEQDSQTEEERKQDL